MIQGPHLVKQQENFWEGKKSHKKDSFAEFVKDFSCGFMDQGSVLLSL